MKKMVVLVVIILTIVAVAYFRLIPLPGVPSQNSGGTKAPPTTSLPAPAPTQPPTATVTPAPLPATPKPTTAPLPTPTPTPPAPPPPATPPPSGSNVAFDLTVTGVTGSGLSRTVTAQVTNTGTSAAHNVWAKVEVASKGTRIQLSGQDYLRVEIGTLAAGATVNKEATFSVGLMDGLNIAQNGATATLTVYSDEKTQTFSYDFTA